MTQTHLTEQPQQGERSFKLTLTARASGINAAGCEFREQTEICSISADRAVFHLRSPVTIGSEISLSLQIPRTIILENPMSLFLTGKVALVQGDRLNGFQLISLRLKKSYRIQSRS